uniref:Uncharacterized protein n=1 Tax=Micrurus surinamensis TaxID=129470 RepID=A0A2D4PLQ4_MICSU
MLFGKVLEPHLVESRDKKKYLPSLNQRSSFRAAPYNHRSSHKGEGIQGLKGPRGNPTTGKNALRTEQPVTDLSIQASDPFVGEKVASSDAPDKDSSSPPIGERLSHFAAQWGKKYPSNFDPQNILS